MTALVVGLALALAVGVPMAVRLAQILTEPDWPPQRRDDDGGRRDPTRPVTQ